MSKSSIDAMHTRVKPLAPKSEADERCNGSWPEELKLIANMLVDLAARNLESNGKKLVLNEIFTVEELAIRLKVPISTIEELARKGKLPGAFRVGKHWRFDLDILRAALPIDENGTP